MQHLCFCEFKCHSTDVEVVGPELQAASWLQVHVLCLRVFSITYYLYIINLYIINRKSVHSET